MPPPSGADARQFELVKQVLLHELEHFNEGASGISISAMGLASGEAGGTHTLSIWITGEAGARPAPKAQQTAATDVHAAPGDKAKPKPR